MDEWLSISQIQEQTGIPERTVRRYLARYREQLHLKTHNRSYLVDPMVLPLLLEIRDLYAQGHSHQKVLEAIRSRISSAEGADNLAVETLVATDDNGGDSAVEAEIPESDLRQALEGLRDELETIRSQLVSEAQARTQAEEARDLYILKRDEQLVATMRQLLNERKKPWWQRRGTSVV